MQAVQAAQITFEDFFMADLQIAPLKIVGYEGLFGTIIMIAVMLPIVQFVPGVDGSGIHEDTAETLKVTHMMDMTQTQPSAVHYRASHCHLRSAMPD